MKKSLIVCFLLLSYSGTSMADTACGPFVIGWKSNDGFARINGNKPESQKITFQKAKEDYDNVTIQWMMPEPKVGRWVGMDFIARNGKPILNVEVVRANMDEPRQFWTYDCKRVK